MNLTLAAFVALLPSLAAAAPSIESQISAGSAAFETAPAAASALARRPVVATMEGGFSGQTASLTLDRRAWTIVGGLGGFPADIHIDNDAKTVTGAANGQTVALTFDWTPQIVSYKGAVNGSQIEYSIDWQAGVVDGSANGSKLHLEFSLADGTVDGKTRVPSMARPSA